MTAWTETNRSSGGEVPAAEVPATQQALARARRRAVGLLLIGVLVLVGFVVASSVVKEANDELRATGGQTTGTIQALIPGDQFSSRHADVRYTAAGQTHTELVVLGAEADNYEEGQRVTVFYDPADPARMTIDDIVNQPGWSTWPMTMAPIGGCCAVVAAIWSWARSRRTQLLLRADAWQPVTVWIAKYKNFFVLRTADGTSWRPAGPLPSCPWPRSTWLPAGSADEMTVGVSPGQSAWWVVEGDRAVFSPDQSSPLLLARRR